MKTDKMAANAAKIFLSGKSKYTEKDFPTFSGATLNQIIAQSGVNSMYGRAASAALAKKKPTDK